MRDSNAVQPATRGDWAELAKVAGLMDLVMVVGMLMCFLLGGHR